LYLGRRSQVVVSVYNNKKLEEDVVITLSKMLLENNNGFAKYSKDKYKIQNVELVPYPKKRRGN
jgi:hypothetical protein